MVCHVGVVMDDASAMLQDFNFQVLQPCWLCLDVCSAVYNYGLEAARKCGFDTRDKWLGLLHLSL